MRHLIWVCTVCLCPIYRTLGINGLIRACPEYTEKKNKTKTKCKSSCDIWPPDWWRHDAKNIIGIFRRQVFLPIWPTRFVCLFVFYVPPRTETEPRFKVSAEGLVELGTEPAIPIWSTSILHLDLVCSTLSWWLSVCKRLSVPLRFFFPYHWYESLNYFSFIY